MYIYIYALTDIIVRTPTYWNCIVFEKIQTRTESEGINNWDNGNSEQNQIKKNTYKYMYICMYV